MKIALVNPPTVIEPNESTVFVPIYNELQHSGLSYIAGMLEKNKYDVTVIESDCNRYNVDEVSDILANGHYNMIGFSVYYYNLVNVLKILFKLKHRISKDTFVFAGGYYASLYPEKLLSKCRIINCCIIGEGEFTTVELAKCLSEKISYYNIKGIAYLLDDKINITALRKQEKDLSIFDFPKISYISNTKTAGILTSRGCFGNCSFCAIHSYSKKMNYCVRFRTADQIFTEVKSLVAQGIRNIQILDDNFLCHIYNKENTILKLCKLIKENNIKINIYIYARTNEILKGEKELKELKEVGLVSVFVGIESFIQRQLDLYKKGVTVEDNIKAIKLLNYLKIPYVLGMIFFDPYLTLSELKVNLTTIKELNALEINHDLTSPISIGSQLKPIPDTALYRLIQAENLLDKSELGFKFVYEELNIYYHNIHTWQEKVSSFYYDIREKIYILNDLRYYTIRKELLILDLEFMIYLADVQQSKRIDYEYWDMQLNKLKDSMEEITKSIMNK